MLTRTDKDQFLSEYSVTEKVKELLEASVSPNTRRAYTSRIKMYEKWCAVGGALPHSPASAGLLSSYIAYLVNTGNSISTIEQSMAAISFMHRVQGYGDVDVTKIELVKRTLKGAKRTIGTAATRKKDAIRIPVLKAIIAGINRDNAIGYRDAALILLGFAGAFRRSELVALNLSDISPVLTADGRKAYEIFVRRSKTDQEAAGMTKGIFSAQGDRCICPVLALQEYISLCGINSGPLFVRIYKGNKIAYTERLRDQSVAHIIQRRAKNVGIELNVAGHSLRSGFITSAAEAERTERSIQNQTGHKSVVTLRSYIQRVSVLNENAADGLI